MQEYFSKVLRTINQKIRDLKEIEHADTNYMKTLEKGEVSRIESAAKTQQHGFDRVIKFKLNLDVSLDKIRGLLMKDLEASTEEPINFKQKNRRGSIAS